MPTLEIPKPSPKQMQFLQDRHKYICFGGARGGGKSWAVRVKAVLLCLRYPGIQVMIVRRTYPELRENHILPLCRMLGCYGPEKERIEGKLREDALEAKDFKSVSGALKELSELQAGREKPNGESTTLTVSFVGETEEMSR